MLALDVDIFLSSLSSGETHVSVLCQCAGYDRDLYCTETLFLSVAILVPLLLHH